MTHYLVTSAYGVYDDTVPGFLPPDQAARAAAPGSGITVVADYVALDAALVAASKTPTGLGVQSLLQYANNKLNNLRALERSYTLSGSPSVTVKCDSLQSTGTDLISLMTWGQANPSGTDTWVDNEGNTTSIRLASCYACERCAGVREIVVGRARDSMRRNQSCDDHKHVAD